MDEKTSGNKPADTHQANPEELKTLNFREMPTVHQGSPSESARQGVTPTGPAPEAGQPFGNYQIVRLLGQGGFGQVWEAVSLETGSGSNARADWLLRSITLTAFMSSGLKRSMAIQRFSDELKAPQAARLTANRPGRLRWLNGSRRTAEAWDAYEAPSGTSLWEWMSHCGKLSWQEMRELVAGLADELKAELEEPSGPGDWSLKHVWVDGYGQARLLDFPAVELKPGDDVATLQSRGDWKAFLHQVTLFGLEGKALSPQELDGKLPLTPLPEYARPLLAAICGQDPSATSPNDLLWRFQSVANKPASITRLRRAGPLLTLAAPSVLVLTLVAAFAFLLPRLLKESWLGDLSNSNFYKVLREPEGGGTSNKDRATREAVRVVLASSFGKARTLPEGQSMVEQLKRDRETYAILEAALQDYPAPSSEEVAKARRTLSEAGLGTTSDFGLHLSPSKGLKLFTMSLGICSFPALLLSFIARGGALLFLFGIAVQTGDGRRASRWRCLARALVVWAPFSVVFVLTVGEWKFAGHLPFQLVFLLGALAGTIFCVVQPERGVSDLVVGTHLVPR